MVKITNNIALEMEQFILSKHFDKIYVLTDTNTNVRCLPLLNNVEALRNATHITIKADDTNKNIEQVVFIWDTLSKSGASRSSLLVNVGGGMVTDLGGFAGATFKRGIHNLNIPTTLMASIDAAVGGKTGINFNGLKNEIGSFYQPDCVMIDCIFLKTLDRDNILSGFAEMIKHGLISDRDHYHRILSFEIEPQVLDVSSLNPLVGQSVAVKERIVATDPKEHGIRKALNFGHTVGHALESLSFMKQRPLLHGQAVAVGLICELYLSHKHSNMPLDILRQTTHFIKSGYTPFSFSCKDYETIYELMMHDKKNEGGHIHFTLLKDIGDICINQDIPKALILESFDFYRENMGV